MLVVQEERVFTDKKASTIRLIDVIRICDGLKTHEHYKIQYRRLKYISEEGHVSSFLLRELLINMSNYIDFKSESHKEDYETLLELTMYDEGIGFKNNHLFQKEDLTRVKIFIKIWDCLFKFLNYKRSF